MNRLSKEMTMQVTGGDSDLTSGEKPYKVGKTWYIQCAKSIWSNTLKRYYNCGKIYSDSSKSAVKTALNNHYKYNPEHHPYEDPNSWR